MMRNALTNALINALTHAKKRLFVTLPVFVALIALTSCTIVKVDGFEHEETNRMLNTFYWTSEKASLEELLPDNLEGPVLVPDFQSVLSNDSSTTSLRVITKENTPLVVERFVIGSTETGLSDIQAVDAVTVPVMRNSGIWVATLKIPLAEKSRVFEKSEEVRLSIAWKYPDDSEFHTTDFVLKRRQRRNVAWPT